MDGIKIVMADNTRGSGLELLRREFGADAIEARGKFDEAELIEKIGSMDALVVRSATTVTAKAIARAGKRLKVIGRAGVGTDNIDKQAATQRGIVVMNTPFGNTVSAAEQAIALLFATARNLARADHLMQARQWEKKTLVGSEVYGKVLGLVGLGRIGGHVAKVMQAAGMTAIAYDPHLSADRAKQIGVELTGSVDELLARADFVTIHTPLTDETRNLINADRLAKMKKGARLVNCARGGIVDEQALADAVGRGNLAAAGLDVFLKEPMTEGPLFGVKNITLTPHLGASTEEAEERCGLQVAEQLVEFFRKQRIVNAVNVEYAAVSETMRPYVELARAMGKIGAVLLNAAPAEIEVAWSSRVGREDTGELVAAAAMGVIQNTGIEDVNLVNAPTLARERGLLVKSSSSSADTDVSCLDVRLAGGGKETRLAGTVYAGTRTPRIIRVDDAEMEVRLNKHLLFLRYPDEPGWVGKVGSLIARHGLNIDTLQVGALKSRQRASMIIGMHEAAPEAMLGELRALPGLERAWLVNL